MKNISILGSTGSIGRNTLRVIEGFSDEFGVAALSAGTNARLLAEQVARHHPRLVAVADAKTADELCHKLRSRGVLRPPRIMTGMEGLIEVATVAGAEIVVVAVVGARALLPTYHALEAGRRIALANKEALVVAGELMMRAAQRAGAEVLPIDSEHNAIHQCLRGESRGELRRLILTASGGPFRRSSKEQIENATPAAALRHPTWKMGDKITIDSATLMNKGLEVMEAHWLFECAADQIDVIIHPQSVVHSMIELIDGSFIAQLGTPDMRHAIQYTLTYPARRQSCSPAMEPAQLGRLEFHAPNRELFPCLGLAFEALASGGTMPAVLNAANEIAVAAFLAGQIGFGEIPRLIRQACSAHTQQAATSLESVLSADTWARQFVGRLVSEK